MNTQKEAKMQAVCVVACSWNKRQKTVVTILMAFSALVMGGYMIEFKKQKNDTACSRTPEFASHHLAR